jgi:tetratricopeptide (TPR) repeat protein
LQKNQWNDAVTYLEKAARLLPRDAETLTNLGIGLRGAGRIDAALDAYNSALAASPDYLLALTNLGNLYYETGRTPDALATFARVLKLSPNNPAAHFNYANALLSSGKMHDAIGRYEHALKLKPDYLDAMINLGMALTHAGKGDRAKEWLAIARTWFDKALEKDPSNVTAMNNIANVLRQQGKPEEAVAFYTKALDIRPDYAEAAINRATSLRDLNRLDEAMASCRQALQVKPHSAEARVNLGAMLQDAMRHTEAAQIFTEALDIKPSLLDARWNKSLSLLALGQYREGWELHETGLGVAHMRGEYPSPERRWNGEDLGGKRLLIWAEQGLGDTLQFIRYAEMCKARCGKLILICPRPLRTLLANMEYIDELPDTVEEKDFDAHVPMMSLPYIFGTLLDTIPAKVPYLSISDEKRAAWADKIPASEKLKVGLVWAGNPRENQLNAHMADKRRSMRLDMLRPLFDVQGVEFYNLQMGAKAAQIDECGLRDRFIDLMNDVKDFEDTGAILKKLDLVISVDTSVVHLAGGMGKPVWVLSRFDACWRWLQNRPDSPWYPTARVFGQKTHGEWGAVVEAVRAELEKQIGSNARPG